MTTPEELIAKGEEIRRLAFTAFAGEVMAESQGAPVPPWIYADFDMSTRAITERFQWFAKGEPTVVASMVAGLDQARHALSKPDGVDLGTLKDAAAEWQGHAADQFRHDFLIPFHGVSLNQLRFIEAAATALRSYGEILTRGRDSAATIADQTIAKLRAGVSPSNRDFGVAFIAAGFAIAGLVSGPATALALRFALLEKGIDLGNKALSINGETVAQALATMNTALDQYTEVYNDQLRHLANAITADLHRTHETYTSPETWGPYEQRELSYVMPSRPYVIAAADRGNYGEFTPIDR